MTPNTPSSVSETTADDLIAGLAGLLHYLPDWHPGRDLLKQTIAHLRRLSQRAEAAGQSTREPPHCPTCECRSDSEFLPPAPSTAPRDAMTDWRNGENMAAQNKPSDFEALGGAPSTAPCERCEGAGEIQQCDGPTGHMESCPRCAEKSPQEPQR